MLATRRTLYGPRVTLPVGLDEMVDGHGGLRPHWRGLLGAFSTLGEGGLQEAARRVDRAFEDEGVTSILPGVERLAWRCDPIPLPLLASEFQELATGLAQRATTAGRFARRSLRPAIAAVRWRAATLAGVSEPRLSARLPRQCRRRDLDRSGWSITLPI